MIDFFDAYLALILGGGSGGGGGTIGQHIIANQTVGGIDSGTDIPADTPNSQIITNILVKDIAPTMSSTWTQAGGTFNALTPDSRSVSKVVCNIVKNSASEFNKVEVYYGSELVQTFDIVNVGSNTFNLDTPIVISESSVTTKTMKAKLYYKNASGVDKTIENSANYVFVYPYIYGKEGAEAQYAVSKGDKTITVDLANEKFVFKYPASYGNLSKIFDKNNFDVTPSFTKTTETISGVDYNVYTSGLATYSGTYKFTY